MIPIHKSLPPDNQPNAPKIADKVGMLGPRKVKDLKKLFKLEFPELKLSKKSLEYIQKRLKSLDKGAPSEKVVDKFFEKLTEKLVTTSVKTTYIALEALEECEDVLRTRGNDHVSESKRSSFEHAFSIGGEPILSEQVKKQDVMESAAKIYEKRGDTQTATDLRTMKKDRGIEWFSSQRARQMSKERQLGLRTSTEVAAVRVNARQHTVSLPGNAAPYTFDRGAALTNFSDGANNLQDLKTKTTPEGIKEYEKRRDYLDCLMLQRLESAVQIEPESKIATSRQLNILQISTMNETVKEDKSGTRWDEENFMKDMNEIFDQYNDKEIFFDPTKAPSVVRDPTTGTIKAIYLTPPEGKSLEPYEPVSLCTLFFNYSVQGGLPKKSIQSEINQKSLEKLKPLFAPEGHREKLQQVKGILDLCGPLLPLTPKNTQTESQTDIQTESQLAVYMTQLRTLNKALDDANVTAIIDAIDSGQEWSTISYNTIVAQINASRAISNDLTAKLFDKVSATKKSSYDVITDMSELAQKMGFSLGINCASGKDRTGLAIIKFITRIAQNSLPLLKFQEIRSKLARFLIQPTSAALHVAYENISVHVFKLQIIKIEGESFFDQLIRAITAWRAAG